MSRLQLLSALAASAALLAACGGGSDDPAPAPPAASPTPAPPVASPPPASATATQANANRLAQEAYDAIRAAEAQQALPRLPGGVLVETACTNGGSFSYDFPSTFGAGTRYTLSYNNCSYAPGYLYNGTYEIVYSNFTSPTNYSFSVNYNLRFTGPGIDYAYTGSQTCTAAGTGLSCTYSDGRRSFDGSFSYTGGTVSGSYSFSDTSLGTLTYTFSGFTATSGTVSVSGSDGFSATITRTGANTFSVVINGSSPFSVTISG